jgi:hypothetical protein
MKDHFTGGCLCGAVRYECWGVPIAMGNCHCRDCQRSTGGPFAPAILVPRIAVKVTGTVQYYEVEGETGSPVRRGFCPKCGSRLFSEPPIAALFSIMAGSLDDPSQFQPEMDFYTGSAQPWDYMNPALPKFEKMPTIG